MENEKELVTGLETASNRKEAEYDIVRALLEAAAFKTDDDLITEAEIRRKGKVLFTVHLHPVSDQDVRFVRKKATSYMPNPNGKKLPPIEKEFNSALFNSWLIYVATTEEDQQKLWGQPAVMQKYGLMEPQESVDLLLTFGEKSRLVDLISDISGMNDDGDALDEEAYAKN